MSAELVAVLFVVATHIADEGALVAIRAALGGGMEPRLELGVKGVEIPTTVVCAQMSQGFVCQVAARLLGRRRLFLDPLGWGGASG